MGKCKCSFAISIVGEGCRWCQPQNYIEHLRDHMEENKEEAREVVKQLLEALITADFELRYHGGSVSQRRDASLHCS